MRSRAGKPTAALKVQAGGVARGVGWVFFEQGKGLEALEASFIAVGYSYKKDPKVKMKNSMVLANYKEALAEIVETRSGPPPPSGY